MWKCKLFLPLFVFIFSIPVLAGTCGPFGMFSGSNYCVKCPGKKPAKVYHCPGGDGGLIFLKDQYKECEISYHNKKCSASAPTSVQLNISTEFANISPTSYGEAISHQLTPESIPPSNLTDGPQLKSRATVPFEKPFKIYADTPTMDVSGESKKGTTRITYTPNPLDINQYVFDVNSVDIKEKKVKRDRYSRCAAQFDDFIHINSEISAPRSMTLYATVETPVSYDLSEIGKKGEIWCTFDVKAYLVTPHEIMMRKQIWQWYLAKHDDLEKAFQHDVIKAENHYFAFGVKEGRMPNPTFDPKWYLNRYKDLKKAFGSDYVKAADHWTTYGQRECRDGSASFSPKRYLSMHKDVAKHYGSKNCPGAVEHYLTYGYFESRKI